MQERQNTIYDEIVIAEADITDVQTRLTNIRQQKISEDNVYQFLLYFDKLYDKFTDAEKKGFIKSFIEKYKNAKDNAAFSHCIDVMAQLMLKYF